MLLRSLPLILLLTGCSPLSSLLTVDSVYQITKKEEPVITAIQSPHVVKGSRLPSKKLEQEEPLVPVWMIMIAAVSGILHLFARKRNKPTIEQKTFRRTTIISRGRK